MVPAIMANSFTTPIPSAFPVIKCSSSIAVMDTLALRAMGVFILGHRK